MAQSIADLASKVRRKFDGSKPSPLNGLPAWTGIHGSLNRDECATLPTDRTRQNQPLAMHFANKSVYLPRRTFLIYVSMLDHMGASVERVGDSTGQLNNL